MRFGVKIETTAGSLKRMFEKFGGRRIRYDQNPLPGMLGSGGRAAALGRPLGDLEIFGELWYSSRRMADVRENSLMGRWGCCGSGSVRGFEQKIWKNRFWLKATR